MKAILILAGPYSSCAATENIWKKICTENNIEFEKFDLSDSQGKDIARKHNLKSFPVLIIDNAIVAVGHPDQKNAEDVINSLHILR